MTRTLTQLLGFFLFLVSAAIACAGDIPDVFEMVFPVGGSYTVRSEPSGAATYEGLGATWTVTDHAAQITFAGSYPSTAISPHAVFYWYSLGQTMPLSVNVTSAYGGGYHIVPGLQETSGSPVTISLAQWFVVGDAYFGHNIPDMYMAFLQVSLESPNTPWDMTINMEWGPGVPNEETSWGSVKSLFR